MPRWVLEIPKTESEQILELATREKVPARWMLICCLKDGIAKRLCSVDIAEPVTEPAAA